MSNGSVAVCSSAACAQMGKEILQNLSPKYQSIDPCEDFETYACQGFRDHHELRPDQSSVGTFTILAEEGEDILRDVLENPYPGSSNHSFFSPVRLTVTTTNVDEQNFDKAQKAYIACKDVEAIHKAGTAPLEAVIRELQSTFDNCTTWAIPLIYLNKLNLAAFVGLYVDANDKSPDEQMVRSSPPPSPGLLPSKDMYGDNETVAAYQKAMDHTLAGFNSTIKYQKDMAARIVAFETSLAEITPDLEDLQSNALSYNLMSVDETAALAPELGLKMILTALKPSNYTLGKMNTPFVSYWGNLSSVLKDTPKQTIQDALVWNLLSSMAGPINATAVEPLQRFERELDGKDPDAIPERYRTCVNHVDDGLGWITSRFFVEKTYSAKAKQLGNQIISDIKKYYINRFPELDWMSDEVKKLAAQKVSNIVQKVGYPELSPNITDPQALADYYEELDIGHSYFRNVVNVNRFKLEQNWQQLNKPTDRNKWGMTASTVNAYYNPSGNEIVFPAGISRGNFFGVDLPLVLNYGAFGAVAGHEMGHAFDQNGRLYNVDGALSDWWDTKTVAAFTQKAQCFVDEYSNFTVNTNSSSGPLHVNGRLTEGENLADSGGLNAAFNAWQVRRKTEPEQTLPGLQNFTQEQLFYISYANVWCTKYSPEAVALQIKTDEHAPAQFRVKGAAMMNQRGFKQAFNCPVKEPTCEIW